MASASSTLPVVLIVLGPSCRCLVHCGHLGSPGTDFLWRLKIEQRRPTRTSWRSARISAFNLLWLQSHNHTSMTPYQRDQPMLMQ